MKQGVMSVLRGPVRVLPSYRRHTRIHALLGPIAEEPPIEINALLQDPPVLIQTGPSRYSDNAFAIPSEFDFAYDNRPSGSDVVISTTITFRDPPLQSQQPISIFPRANSDRNGEVLFTGTTQWNDYGLVVSWPIGYYYSVHYSIVYSRHGVTSPPATLYDVNFPITGGPGFHPFTKLLPVLSTIAVSDTVSLDRPSTSQPYNKVIIKPVKSLLDQQRLSFLSNPDHPGLAQTGEYLQGTEYMVLLVRGAVLEAFISRVSDTNAIEFGPGSQSTLSLQPDGLYTSDFNAFPDGNYDVILIPYSGNSVGTVTGIPLYTRFAFLGGEVISNGVPTSTTPPDTAQLVLAATVDQHPIGSRRIVAFSASLEGVDVLGGKFFSL